MASKWKYSVIRNPFNSAEETEYLLNLLHELYDLEFVGRLELLTAIDTGLREHLVFRKPWVPALLTQANLKEVITAVAARTGKPTPEEAFKSLGARDSG